MTEIDGLLESIKKVVEEWRAINGQGNPSADQVQRFNAALARPYQLGWDNALGWKQELPDEFLPDRYI